MKGLDYKSFFDGLRESVVVITPRRDPDGRVVDWVFVSANKAALEILGRSLDQVVGCTASELMARARLNRDSTAYERVLRTGEPWSFETNIGPRHFLVSVFCVGDDAVASAALDITERKEADDALRASEQRFRLFVEHAPAAVAMFDRDMRYLAASRRWLSDYRLHHDVIGRSHYEVFPEVPERWREIHARCLAGASEKCGEDPFPRSDGSVDWVRWEIHPWHDAAGVVGGIIMFTEVITDRKRAEEKLRQVDREKNDFLAMLSHELRSPLASMGNSLHVLRLAPEGSEPAMRARSILERQVAHLGRLVDDLLDVTRLSRNKVSLNVQPVDLGPLLEQTVDDYRGAFDHNGIDLEVHVPRDPIPVIADPARMSQLVGNLLQNSAKFTPRGGRTEVLASVDAVAGTAIIRVVDTGAGIAPEMMASLFHPFAQADRTLGLSRGGLGLGLSLVKGFAELHGGEVSVSSKGPGLGAEFSVRLPLAGSPLDRERGGSP